MVHKLNAKVSNETIKGNEQLKWETAKELGLDDDLAAGGDELSVKEAGKIGDFIFHLDCYRLPAKIG